MANKLLKSLTFPDLVDTYIIPEPFGAYPHDTASGAIASFPDGADGVPVKDLSVAIAPTQDLHGQANPYPGGATKNKFQATPYGGTYNGAVGSNLATDDGMGYSLAYNAVKINVTTAWRYRLFATAPLPAGQYTVRMYSETDAVRGTSYITDGSLNVVSVINNYSASGYSTPDTVTVTEGQRIAISIGANAVGTITVNFQVEPGTTSTDFVLFENICPISGWTGANVTRTGKNLFDKDAVSVGKWLSTTTGEEETDGSYCATDYIPVESGKTVYIPSSGTARRWFYDTFKNPVTYLNQSNDQAFTPTADGYIRVSIATAGSYAKDLNAYQIEYGSTATTYEPYAGNTYSITFPDAAGTVYGGTLDVTTGKLTIKTRGVQINRFSDAWGAGINGYAVYYSLTGTTHVISSESDRALLKSNIFTHSNGSRSNMRLYTYGGSDGADKVNTFILPASVTSLAEANTWLTNLSEPLFCTFLLATPVEYTLTPVEVATLLGYNNIWADCGNSTVDYRADTTLYIQRLTGEAEDDMVANAPIASGEYFIVNNKLYLATASIAAGATLTVGTNCVETNLAAALNAINS